MTRKIKPKKTNFYSSSWEEEMFLNDIEYILDEIEAPHESKSFLFDEQIILRLLYMTDVYLENIAIREGGQGATDHITHKLSEKFSILRYSLEHKITSKSPLKTYVRDNEIALFIDCLVFHGAEKTKAINATADWLAMGEKLVEKIAKNHCRLKKSGGKISGDKRIFENGMLLLAAKMRGFINRQKSSFPKIEPSAHSAFSKLMDAIKEAENQWEAMRAFKKTG